MNEIEKRELTEQQRKIFEAGTQRADKRTGSFSFLTWPFFIAPLLASEEFLAATFKSAAAKEQERCRLIAAARERGKTQSRRIVCEVLRACISAKHAPWSGSVAQLLGTAA